MRRETDNEESKARERQGQPVVASSNKKLGFGGKGPDQHGPCQIEI